MEYLEIEKVIGREIIDSRGNPTVEAEVYLADGTIGRGAAPSGITENSGHELKIRTKLSEEKVFPKLLKISIQLSTMR